MTDWMHLANEDDVPSPALLLYPDRIDENLRRMLAIAGSPERLRPHVKTHKLPQIVVRKLALGIRKFKTATIAESEMCAQAGAPDVLLAYQPVGPNASRLAALAKTYPQVRFSCVVDDPAPLLAVAAAARAQGVTLGIWLDLDLGTLRTGIIPGPEAAALYRLASQTPGVRPEGLHVYDGHLRSSDPVALGKLVDDAYAPVWRLRAQIIAERLPVPAIVAGGTPTFPILAKYPDVELGAGTTVLWDASSLDQFPYLDFLPAALVLTRVVSRTTPGRFCLDLGHKAIASEMPHPRVRLIGLEDAAFGRHNEEHLVVESSLAGDYPLGRALYGIPRHICPTVALHDRAAIVRNGRAEESWPIAARARRLII